MEKVPTRPIVSYAAGLTILLGACTDTTPPARVSLDAPSFITATGDTVPLRETLRIGRLDGPDEYTFAGILWTLPTPDGGVILYDLETDDLYGHDGRIRQFDAEGRFVRYIGRPGEGPGEHRPFPLATLLTSGDLLIADQGLARFTRYNAAGELVASWPGPSAIVELQAAIDDGWLAATVTDHPREKPRRIAYLRYDSLGAEFGQVMAPDAYHDGPYGGFGAVDLPNVAVAILPDGRMITTRNDSLLLVISGPEGERRVSAPHKPVAYLPEEAAARRAMIAGRAARARQSDPGVEVPLIKMVSSWLQADRGGRILVRLRTAGFLGDTTIALTGNQTPWRESFAVEVFDSSAIHRGRLVAPRRITGRGASFSDNAVWMVEEGESGELYLVKWVPDSVVW
jgi:hypothetical protein